MFVVRVIHDRCKLRNPPSLYYENSVMPGFMHSLLPFIRTIFRELIIRQYREFQLQAFTGTFFTLLKAF